MKWEDNGDGCPNPKRWRNRNGATMSGDDGMDNCQAEPRPGADGITAAIKALKEMGDVVGGDTRTVITDCNAGRISCGRGVDGNCPIECGMADGVINDVVERCLQLHFVDRYDGVGDITGVGKRNVFFETQWGKRLICLWK